MSHVLRCDAVVTHPLLQALEKGLNDVPLILCTMRDESDLSQNNDIVNWTSEQLTSFLNSHFAPWSSTLGATIASLVLQLDTSLRVHELCVAD